MVDNLLVYLVIGICVLIPVTICVVSGIRDLQFKRLNAEALKILKLSDWKYMYYDVVIDLKSSKAVDNYTPLKFFQENKNRFDEVSKKLVNKQEYANLLKSLLNNNELKGKPTYAKLEKQIHLNLAKLSYYSIDVSYVSPKGNSTNRKSISIDQQFLDMIKSDPSLIMSKSEYNRFLKEKNQEQLSQKQHEYYERVNKIIDSANEFNDKLIIKGDQDELEKIISALFEKTVNSIKKIKSIDSDEWGMIENVITNAKKGVNQIIENNQKIIDYYNSPAFVQIKTTCDVLMESQRDFNEYINEKAQSISSLFGSRVIRNETENNDEYNYIRPYRKSITPYTAEVSSAVFASAENNPLDYIVKYFYPNKDLYPDQIQKLQFLVEELETLKDAKQIIENYKKDYQQYITDVPDYIMKNDEDGFYSRLGFANIGESALTVEYKFSYTSEGGMAKRSFTVPMTEDVIVDLIGKLQSKLTMSAFVKEQRNLMTSKLRQEIKERDNYTCKYCDNSTYKEPNLLLEIDHIIPVSKGGYTVKDNLQTLCWKCNRKKSSKII